MNNPKLENLLNLSLEASREEREKSQSLAVGFDSRDRVWDLIVKYNGDLSGLAAMGISVTELQNEYAVLKVPESLVDQLAELEQIEYVEKPKRLYFALEQGRRSSCVTLVQNRHFGLFGRGILVACLDSGVDYAHPDFCNADGSSRIRYLWDQTIPGNPPQGYRLGTEYTGEQINEALQQRTREERLRLVPSTDANGHGTAVLGIAAGNGRASNGKFRGMASESQILVVKLGTPGPDSFPRTTELMQAVDYCVRKAVYLQLPLAVNISFGNTYGSHTGNSLLETYLTDMANHWKCVFCIGTGNEGVSDGHTAGKLIAGEPVQVEFAVGEYEPSFSVQLWKEYVDKVEVYLIHPDGQTAGPLREEAGPQRFMLGNTEVLAYYGSPTPYSTNQEIYFDFLPGKEYVDGGVWKIGLLPMRIVDGAYRMWMPSLAALNGNTRFLYPVSENTITIPATAGKVIAVGAYDSRNLSYADFSGRGEMITVPGLRGNKPDLVAPGVDVITASVGGGYEPRTGTSFATPFVTGAAALLMQWGITEGNDPFLYGEKVRAYLQRGAKALPGFSSYPNPLVGYGALCVRDSLPV